MRSIFEDIPFLPQPTHEVDRWLQLPMGWSVEFARYLIDKVWVDDAVVIDPMMGAGATLVAANELGHDAVGIDLDALAVLGAYAKTAPPVPFEEANASGRVLETSRLEPMALKELLMDGCTPTLVRCLAACLLYRVGTQPTLRDSLPDVRTETIELLTRPSVRTARVVWGNARSEATWNSLRERCDARAWTIVFSPPHPASRGRLELPRDIHDHLTGLADRVSWWRDSSISPPQVPSRFGIQQLSETLQAIRRSCPTETTLVIEYENTVRERRSVEIERAADSEGWVLESALKLYETAPDHREEVTEGGVVLLRPQIVRAHM